MSRERISEQRLQDLDVLGHSRCDAVLQLLVEALVRDRLPYARPAAVPCLEPWRVAEAAAYGLFVLPHRAEQLGIRELVRLEVEPDLDRPQLASMPGLVVDVLVAVDELDEAGS